MSDIKGKYKKILEDLENNIKDPEDLIYIKEKVIELTTIFMDIIDRLTVLTDARIKEIEERQEEINSKIESVQSMVDEIEGDIYEDEDSYEFEIVCPYCNYEFTTDIADEEKDEIRRQMRRAVHRHRRRGRGRVPHGRPEGYAGRHTAGRIRRKSG